MGCGMFLWRNTVTMKTNTTSYHLDLDSQKCNHGCATFYRQISELEQDKRDLERNVNELKAKCEQIEKRAAELRQVEEKKHAEELQFLKRTNAQLKVTCCTIVLPIMVDKTSLTQTY